MILGNISVAPIFPAHLQLAVRQPSSTPALRPAEAGGTNGPRLCESQPFPFPVITTNNSWSLRPSTSKHCRAKATPNKNARHLQIPPNPKTSVFVIPRCLDHLSQSERLFLGKKLVSGFGKPIWYLAFGHSPIQPFPPSPLRYSVTR
jgi:hypothetical protein